jgi:lactaldehyde dehydrogenase/glycolaldehyde dehydrogenase
LTRRRWRTFDLPRLVREHARPRRWRLRETVDPSSRARITLYTHRSDDANEHIYLHKIPLGVSVGICPWNFPVFVMARKLAPALVTGNTVVVKSSEVTPLTCARIAELWTASNDAAMPPKGTYSVITGLGSTVGAALVSSPLVDIVSMTGSVATGKAIMKSAAEHMTKVSLELGGKAPAIVCAGMDSVSRLRLATGAAMALS